VALTRHFTMVDLFAGAGGLTLGFTWEGFEPIFAVEIEAAAVKTYEANFGCHVYPGAIEHVDVFPKADIIVGGPPCQGFSPLGRDRDEHSRAALNSLWEQYVRAVRQVRPSVFVVENVPQFLRSAQFQTFMETFAEDDDFSDYKILSGILNAADFGVPQRRRRGIVIGSRIGAPVWPNPTHGPVSESGQPYKTVREAIVDLPLVPDDENLHFGRNPRPSSIERYKAVPEGGNRFDLGRNRPDLLPECWKNKKSGTTDVFGRLWWDRPAFTIRTEFFKPEKGRYLHPQAHRPITHREAARLQTFPDTFTFEGSKIEIARQIGNAVPPVLAQAVAQAVRSVLTR
jgi:DNA (cytosine-5)-methyltransferase 1